jgi:hypothetical protein
VLASSARLPDDRGAEDDMRRLAYFAAMLLLAAPYSAFADTPPGASAVAPSAQAYAEQRAKAANGDPSTDFTLLRLSYAQSDGYDPYSFKVGELRKQAEDAADAKHCTDALAKADEVLKTDFVDFAAHAIRKDCFDQMADKDNAAREFFIANGLLHAMFASGDGKSPDTAFVVVTLREERDILAFLHVDAPNQSLVHSNGREYDLMEGSNRDTKVPAAVYFDVSNLFAGLDRELLEPKKQ